MIEVYRDGESVTVGWLQSLLESEGIETFMKNQAVSSTEAIIPPLFPAICVLNPQDEERARKLIKDALSSRNSDSGVEPLSDRLCSSCGEPNPPIFEICWKCEVELEKAG